MNLDRQTIQAKHPKPLTMKKTSIFAGLCSVLLLACGQKSEHQDHATIEAASVAGHTTTTAPLVKLWESEAVLTTSESIIYDQDKDILYVSCIDGKPLDKDGKGFIAQVDLKGNVVTQQWVTGLDAPKGMGINEGKLYVTNIDELVEIDIERGEVVKRYPVEGGTFLNDVTVGKDGHVWFSDSQTGKVHILADGEVSTWTEGIAGPNGLMLRDGNLYVTTMGSHELLEISMETKAVKVLAGGLGGGDGLMDDAHGGFVASDWSGRVFHITGEGSVKELLNTKADQTNSADIWYLADQKLVLVPTFFKNTIAAYQLN